MRLWNTKEGLKAQTVVFNHAKKLDTVNFLKEPEVDLVLPNKKLAFEIKYSKKITKKDAKNLLELPKEFKLFLISIDTYDKLDINGRKVIIIPLWLFVLSI